MRCPTYDTIIYVVTIKCTFYFLIHLFEVCLKTFETVAWESMNADYFKKLTWKILRTYLIIAIVNSLPLVLPPGTPGLSSDLKTFA